jgi:hypothetical protein
MSLLLRPYITDLVDAVCFGYSRSGQSFDREAIAREVASGSSDARRTQAAARTQLRPFAEEYARSCAARGPIEHSCHAISHGFAESLQLLPLGQELPLAITIGNVSYRGTSLYQVTYEKIDAIISHGFDASKTVDVHVWITLQDMTVVDLSLLSTLAAMGLTDSLSPSADQVLIWREDSVSDFEYEPLLVDNEFFLKVERGVVVPGWA